MASERLRRETSSLAMALIVTRRELRDSLRDWRIVWPIVILTLVFPWLMNFTAKVSTSFVEKYGASPIGPRLIPFLLMIVGFFPISISLVIALETFVGEKERNSIEPLLTTPISDGELYLGKMLAAMILPLMGSYLGITVYLVSLYWSMRYVPPLNVLVLIIVLTTMQALVMVSGAVVVSSHTTSVRAANLLASFILIPMALLVQAESVIMFWARYEVLWWIVLGLLVIDLILVRMGVRIFNREEILARQIDELNLRFAWRTFVGFFLRPPGLALASEREGGRFTVSRVYGHDIPHLLRRQWLPLTVVLIVLVASLALGWSYASRYPLPPQAIQLQNLSHDVFEKAPAIGFLPTFSTSGIFFNNVRALLLAVLLAVLSLGVLAFFPLMVPIGLIGLLMGEGPIVGYNPFLFFAAFILPHGIAELPAAIIATAFALRVGASMISPPPGLTVGKGLLLALADFAKVFLFLVMPLLLLAAFLEVNLTPHVVLWLKGAF
ncbi:MAG: stage II sporulation protein M [Anaerolineae bacterium]